MEDEALECLVELALESVADCGLSGIGLFVRVVNLVTAEEPSANKAAIKEHYNRICGGHGASVIDDSIYDGVVGDSIDD